MKAIVTDLDRTLLRMDGQISPYTLETLGKCREKGFMIMAATARPEPSIRQLLDQVRFDAVTTLNGARILLPGRVLEHAIPAESGETVLGRLLAVPGLTLSVETGEGIFANVPIPAWHAVVYDGFPELPAEPLYKILISGGEGTGEGLYEQVQGLLTEDTYCTLAGGDLVQVMSRSATKWRGIVEMLRAFGIAEEDAVYFGDDYDDLEPVEKCGLGVAVANAVEAVKERADAVAGGCDEDGAARFIASRLL